LKLVKGPDGDALLPAGGHDQLIVSSHPHRGNDVSINRKRKYVTIVVIGEFADEIHATR
jgi:hypothetical protein